MSDQSPDPVSQNAKLSTLLFVIIGVLLMMTSVIAFGLLPDRNVTINGHKINALLVDTPAARGKGLGDRSRLGNDEGMLFVFDTPSQYCFWMKDMKFPIDMIWLDQDKRVISVKSNATPDSYPQSFCPASEATYVLEITAGKAQEWQIKEGDQAHFRR